MASTMSFLAATRNRRSVLDITNKSPIPDKQIVEIVEQAILHAPSPFHVQSTRAVVLLKKEHEKLWDIAKELLPTTFPPAMLPTLESKTAGYRAGYGTVLFFEDSTAASAVPPQLAGVMAKYPEWYEHSNGMNQFIVWTALAAEGFGCSLQHYQPGISARVAEEWKIPETWSLRAQLVFGTPTGPPRGGVEKSFAPLENRLKVYGA
ncbi:hypothetical protein MMC13_000278 [Lambiella insularis]|nr:hypothetical protein [Lambiella insularis]